MATEAVRSELEAVLSSRAFAQSESLKRFLKFVVEETLDGRSDELKEFALGAEVFQRGEAYDPRTDPIVRVQATRLRGKLREYYETEGADDRIRISLPKGSYVPAFRERDDALPAEAKSESPGATQGKLTVVVILAVAVGGRARSSLARPIAGKRAEPPASGRSSCCL